MNNIIQQLKWLERQNNFIGFCQLYQFVQLAERSNEQFYNWKMFIVLRSALAHARVSRKINATDKEKNTNEKQDEKEKKEEKDELKSKNFVEVVTVWV